MKTKPVEQPTSDERAKWERDRNKTIKQQRALANAALPELLKNFPPADKIAAREWFPYEKRKPKQSEIADAERALAVDIATYENYRKRGGDAVCDYDLTISSSNDGVAALRGALQLKLNHISYGRGRLAWLHEKLDAQGMLL